MKVLEKCEDCSSGKWRGEACPYCSGWVMEQLLADEWKRSQTQGLFIVDERRRVMKRAALKYKAKRQLWNVYHPEKLKRPNGEIS